jgi:predicted ester cyclase
MTASCFASWGRRRAVSEQDNVQIAEKWIQAVNEHDFGAWEQMRAPGYLWEGPGLPIPAGADAEVVFMKGAYEAFPDVHVEIIQTIAQGDLVVINGVMTGTHDGPMPMPDGHAIPATGRKWSSPFSETLEFKDGKVVRRSIYTDVLGRMVQLGLMPGT